MTAKEYLSLNKTYEKMISEYLNEIQRLNDIATSITQTAKTDVVQTSGSQQRMADAVTDVVYYQEKIRDAVSEMIQYRQDVKTMINSMERTSYREVLWYRYINDYTFEKVAVSMDKSWRHVIRLHGKALAEFQKKYSDKLNLCHCLSYKERDMV